MLVGGTVQASLTKFQNNSKEFGTAIPLSEKHVCTIDEHDRLCTCMHARQQARHRYHWRGAEG